MAGRKRSLEPRREPTQERARVTWRAIVQAAAEVFGREGYTATTAQVAARAGVSVGTLYQYFPNKDALLVTLFHAHLDEAEQAVSGWLDLSGSLEAVVERFVHGTLALHAHAPGLHRVLLVHAVETPELRSRLQGLEDAVRGAVEARLHQEERVQVPDPGLAAHLVVRLVEDLTHHRIVHPDDGVDEGAFVDEVVALVCAYITADRRSP